MNILITGGKGFIGSHTLQLLGSSKHTIYIVDNLSNVSDVLNELPKNTSLIEKDIRDKNLINYLDFDIDVILHLAAQTSVQYSVENPIESSSINIDGFLNILEIAKLKKVKKFVFSSSAAVYGDNSNLPISEEELHQPLSPYALEKSIAEQYIKLYKKLYNLEYVIFRYFNVFGKGQDPNSSYSGVITKFINNIRKEKDLVIFGDGNQTRDFVNVQDVAKANVQAILSDLNGVYNVASGKPTSINYIADILSQNTHIRKIYKEGNKGEIKHSLAYTQKIEKSITFKIENNLDNELLKLL